MYLNLTDFRLDRKTVSDKMNNAALCGVILLIKTVYRVIPV